jgi:hypothetical protein
MQRNEDASLPLKSVPSGIAAVFESREWAAFVESEDRHGATSLPAPLRTNLGNQEKKSVCDGGAAFCVYFSLTDPSLRVDTHFETQSLKLEKGNTQWLTRFLP